VQWLDAVPGAYAPPPVLPWPAAAPESEGGGLGYVNYSTIPFTTGLQFTLLTHGGTDALFF
jgi:hypothetical protein